MERIKIGFDYEAKRQDDSNRPKKASYLLELEAFFYKYQLEFIDEKICFVQSFKEQFALQHSDSFPEFVSLKKMYELAEVNFEVLIALERCYKEIAPIDNNRDYNIYTKNDNQVNAYNLGLELLDVINKTGNLYSPINNKTFNEISICFRGLVTIDKYTSERTVNHKKIQNL